MAKGRISILARPALVFVLLMAGTVLSWRYFITLRRDATDRQFESLAAQQVAGIERRFNELELELSAAQALFRASEQVTRSEFRTFFQEFATKGVTQGLRNVTFAELVQHQNLDAFEQTVRADDSVLLGGYPDFQVFPDYEGPEHVVANYVEPPEASAQLMGFDTYSDPARRSLFEKARDNNSIEMSAQLTLLQSGSPEGFIILAPLYRKGQPIGTSEERRAAFFGVVGAAFETETFFKDALALPASESFDLEIFDIANNNQLIFDSVPEITDAGRVSGRHRDFETSLGQRELLMHLHEQKVTDWANSDLLISVFVILIGTLSSLLVSFVIYSAMTTRRRAESMATRMTADISRSRERYQELLEALPDPALILDKFGRIQSINRAAEQASGYKNSELAGKFFPRAGVVAPSYLPLALRNFAISLAGRTHAPYELGVRIKDGNVRTFEVNARPLREDGKVAGVQVLLRDVTKRREVMDQLARQADELQRINKFMIGRELKMAELKRELEQLRHRGEQQ